MELPLADARSSVRLIRSSQHRTSTLSNGRINHLAFNRDRAFASSDRLVECLDDPSSMIDFVY